MLALTGEDIRDQVKALLHLALCNTEPDINVVKKDMILFARTFGTENQAKLLDKDFTQILMYIAAGGDRL